MKNIYLYTYVTYIYVYINMYLHMFLMFVIPASAERFATNGTGIVLPKNKWNQTTTGALMLPTGI